MVALITQSMAAVEILAETERLERRAEGPGILALIEREDLRPGALTRANKEANAGYWQGLAIAHLPVGSEADKCQKCRDRRRRAHSRFIE